VENLEKQARKNEKRLALNLKNEAAMREEKKSREAARDH
jgi:hypothetical protein